MKQEISPGKGNALHETLVHNAVESASPEYAGHGQATDLPFVVVKLQDEHNSSDTKSAASEWMRPVESTEDEEADQDPTSETEVTSFTSEKHPILSLQKHPNDALPNQEYPDERGKENAAGTTFFSHDIEDSGLPKKRVSKQNNKSSTSPSIRRSKRSVGRKTKSTSQFSKSQVVLIQTFMESHAKDLFGPNKKPANERQSLWKNLILQINTERTENGQKTRSAVKKLAVVYKKADVRPTREPTKCKTSQRSSTKDPANSSDAEEPEWRTTSTKRPFPPSSLHHPPAWGLELGTQEVGSSAFGVSAPYSRLKPACAISPQLATEPPPFPSMQDDRKPKCCEKMEGIVFEVLNYCKFMCTTIQRLEERIDSLQTNSSHLQETHRNFPIPAEDGFDVLDQMARLCSVKGTTRRWPIAVFCNRLDMAARNAHVLFKKCTSTTISRRAFILQLVKELRADYMRVKEASLAAPMEPQQPQATKRKQCQINSHCKQNKTLISCKGCKRSVCGKCTVKVESFCPSCAP